MRSHAQKAADKWSYRKYCDTLYAAAERDKKPNVRKIKSKEEFRAEVEKWQTLTRSSTQRQTIS